MAATGAGHRRLDTARGGNHWFANRAVSRSVGKEHNSSLSPFVTTVALVYGALLGFVVVVAWEQFSSAEANVANEASTLATMYRQTVAMPARSSKRCRIYCASTRPL